MKVKNSDVIRDYWSGFRKATKEKYLFVLLALFAVMPLVFRSLDGESIFRKPENEKMIFLIPVWFGYVSTYTHRLSLPKAMYYAPLSSADREKYIKKMAFCKIFFPFAFMAAFDLVLLPFVNLSAWSVAVQAVSVFLLCFNAAINLENTQETGVHIIYLSQPVLGIMYFSSGEFSKEVFVAKMYIVLMLLITVPTSIYTVHKWPEQRKYYSSFENTAVRGAQK